MYVKFKFAKSTDHVEEINHVYLKFKMRIKWFRYTEFSFKIVAGEKKTGCEKC